MDVDEFMKAFELNVRGPLNIAQAYLRANRDISPDVPRTLINISSGAAHLPYVPRAAAYSISKLAGTRVTDWIHHSNPSWNVFNMQPGVVPTDLARSAGRKAFDSPELSAGLAVWLAANPAARALNGRFLWANWDVEEVLQRKKEIEEKDLLTISLRGWAEDVTAQQLIDRASSLSRDAEKQKQQQQQQQ